MNCFRCGREITGLIALVKQLEGMMLCPECFRKAKKELRYEDESDM
jgi:NMD protein affecting ribosome stability and mRNA decay